jgi:hypothetical protein
LKAKHPFSTTRAKLAALPFPLVALFTCLIGFALFIPVLGFYWDDWAIIFYAQTQRLYGVVSHYAVDRPFSYWTSFIANPLFGGSTLARHLFSFVLRWLAVLAAWGALKTLWPKQQKLVAWAALLFAIYPGFYLQAMSETYSRHWIAYAFYFTSLWAMGAAIRGHKRASPLTIYALGAAALHMFTLEYFVGLELLRPLYIWLLLTERDLKQKLPLRVRKTLLAWWPYLALFILWGVWRFFFLELPEDPYPLVVLQAIRANPIAGTLALLRTVLMDFGRILFVVWGSTVAVAPFSLGTAFNPIFVAVSALAAALVALAHSQPGKKPQQKSEHWPQQAMLLGLWSILVGLIPVWVIGNNLSPGGDEDRFALAALFGAALFSIGLLALLVRSGRMRLIVFGILVALALNTHLNAGEHFRQDWETQREFYWQMYWRAPAVKPDTAFLSFYRISRLMQHSSSSGAINTLYPQTDRVQADFWHFDLRETRVLETIQEQRSFEINYRGLVFQAASPSSLLFFYKMPDGCVWTLSPLHVYNEYIPSENRAILEYAHSEQILPTAVNDSYPATETFGAEPEHTWCYSYEKADLARQLGDWQGVIDLMDKAQQAGLSGNYVLEYFPLIEAYANLGEWEQAGQLSTEVRQGREDSEKMMCVLWEELNLLPGSEAKAAAYTAVTEAYACASR